MGKPEDGAQEEMVRIASVEEKKEWGNCRERDRAGRVSHFRIHATIITQMSIEYNTKRFYIAAEMNGKIGAKEGEPWTQGRGYGS